MCCIDGQQTPLRQRDNPGTSLAQPRSTQNRGSAEHALHTSGALTGTARLNGRSAASPATGLRGAGSQPVNTGRTNAGPKSGRKSVQFATNEQGQLVYNTDAKKRRQNEQNESASMQTTSPDASSPAPSGQVAAALPAVSPQKTLQSKASAKRTKTRPNYVEGF